MKKLPKVIKTIIAGAIIGFLVSILIHSGLTYKLSLGSKSIGWYFYILLIVINFVLIILIHELGHLFSFVFSKIKIKALMVLIFVIKKEKRWQFRVKIKNIKFIGGLVVPNFPAITSEEEYEDLKLKFKKALIMGPIASIAYFLLITLTLIFVWIFTTNNILIAILFYSFIITALMTLLIHKSSKVNYKSLYGDYVAYKKFDEEKFSLLQVVQYLSLSDYQSSDSDLFIYQKLETYFSEKTPTYHLFDFALVSYFINYFIKTNGTNSEPLNKALSYYNINRLTRNSDGLELAYLISAYHYYNGNVELAYQTFERVSGKEYKHTSVEKQQLLKLQYEHYLNIKDNTEEIMTKKSVVLDDLGMLDVLFNVDDMMADLLIKLPFKPFYTKYITFLK